MSTGRYRFAAVAHADKLYVIGGDDDTKLDPSLDSIEVFDIHAGSWCALPVAVLIVSSPVSVER